MSFSTQKVVLVGGSICVRVYIYIKIYKYIYICVCVHVYTRKLQDRPPNHWFLFKAGSPGLPMSHKQTITRSIFHLASCAPAFLLLILPPDTVETLARFRTPMCESVRESVFFLEPPNPTPRRSPNRQVSGLHDSAFSGQHSWSPSGQTNPASQNRSKPLNLQQFHQGTLRYMSDDAHW